MQSASRSLEGRIVRTPLLDLVSNKILDVLPKDTSVKMKLEVFQHAGSFKARGVTLALDKLTEVERKRGVVTFSGGNHALAVSWGTRRESVSTKICMPRAADPYKIEGCRSQGAEVLLFDDNFEAFDAMNEISVSENRKILPPFDSESMILGSSTCGLEIINSFPKLDVAIIPVGGGGLIAGIAAAIKSINPHAVIYGVEPIGADSMSRSFEQSKPVQLENIDTIADSLGAPMTMQYSFNIAKEFVDAIVRIEDSEIINAMQLMRQKLNLAIEPACAVSLAGLIGPLNKMVVGKSVAVIACGSNISPKRYEELLPI